MCFNQAIGVNISPLEIYAHFDIDGNGHVDVHQFFRGLRRLGIETDDALVGRIYVSLVDKTTYISNYNEASHSTFEEIHNLTRHNENWDTS